MNGKRSPLGKATKRQAKAKEITQLNTNKGEAIKRRSKPQNAKHQRKREPTAQAERRQQTHPNKKEKGKASKNAPTRKSEIFEWNPKIS